MKETGITWLPRIPDGWTTRKGKYVFNCVQKPVNEDDGVITCFRDGEVTLRSKRREDGFTIATKEFGYQGIDAGDLVVHGMDGFAGSIGISDSRGKASPVLNNLETKQDKRFFMYFLRNMAYQGVFLALSTGIRVRTCDTNWGKLKELEYAFPNIARQKEISAFLDAKIAKIDSLIAVEEAQIEKLKEYKLRIITEAVTKGLHLNRAEKNSGVNWIEAIPNEWNIGRLKFISSYNDETLPETTNPDDVIEYVDIGSVSLANGIEKTEFFKFSESPSRARRVTRTGDVIVSTVRTYLKSIASIDRDGLIVSTGFCVIRPNEKVHKRFVEYYCKSFTFTDEVSRNSYGISYPAINCSSLMDFGIVLPPMEEQDEIVQYLDDKCETINALETLKRNKIERLNEYKKSLIYEYVTGK